MIETVLCCGTHNFVSAQVPVPTSFDLDTWNTYLHNYDDNIIVQYLCYGWPINYQSDVLPSSTLQNQSSAVKNNLCLLDYLEEELIHRAIIGPFTCNPFSCPCVVSPLQTVPKRNSSKLRVVHDLSFPDGASVNSGIPKDSYLDNDHKLQLPGVDRLIQFIRSHGPHCLIYKKDLARAFRQIPVDPKDVSFLGFPVNNQLYFHTCFPFGLRSATMVCQRVTKAVIHILSSEGYVADVYIDDFYGVEKTELAGVAFNRMTELFKELGLAASPAKDQLPNTQMLVLGIWFNTDDMTISVPEFRLLELRAEISHWLTLEQATKHQLQVLVGKLSYVCSCVRPGRAFMSRLLNELRLCHSRRSIIFVSHELKLDLQWWLHFLDKYNGVSVIGTAFLESGERLFSTDATLTGCGALCEGEYFHDLFPSFITQQQLSITQLELLTVVVAVKRWQIRLQGRCIMLHCDNQACVDMPRFHALTGSFGLQPVTITPEMFSFASI
ncbi:uncharacterized protein LOC114952381 [Acropora millepora]|uniref:uncharacterized protein LOC114952381 n=1 Tax=Acropora millepora TaxID=45264 RepID=UPI001CF26B0E|nr:uncharacterized protein LOC114952381 [Acropora millepora]